jgi:hypothetical protein
MTLFEENPDAAVVFTCPNVACGRTFTTPLKAVNIQLSSETVYDACPYCLTKMTCNERIDAAPFEDSYECKYHLGYLRERKEKTEVPDRCLVCKDMVVCMLGELKR